MPWSYGGSTISQPGTIAVIDNSGIKSVYQQNNREIILVGSAAGGAPKTLLAFSDPQSAINALKSGNGLTAVLRALKPAKDTNVSPGTVRFIRVDPAVQSTYNLVNGATTVLTLTSVDYGNLTKQINTQVTAGSVQGLKSTITDGFKTSTQDNIYQAAINIQYIGASASGLVTVSNSAGQIQGLAGASGSETAQWTAQFSTYTSVQQLVNYINSQAGWTATIQTANPSQNTANYFDDSNSQPCKATAFTVTATLNALATFYNNSGIALASRPNGIGLLPSTMSAPAYFTGGTDGSATNSDWSATLQAIQNEALGRIVVALTDQSTIHAMVDAHCQNMSVPSAKKNRVQIAGGALNENVSQAIARAQLLNSRRTMLCWPGIQDIDPITFQLTTYAPWMVAVQAGAMLSALPVTQALTRQALACIGLEGTLQQTLQSIDYDNLVNNGVCAVKFHQSQINGNSFIFVRSVTTWLGDTKLVNTEISCVCNEDYVALRVATAVDEQEVGQPGSPTGIGQVTSVMDSELRTLYDEGAIVGDKITDAYGGITVSLNNGAVTGNYWFTIPAPMNFFGITAGAQLYSKTTTVAA